MVQCRLSLLALAALCASALAYPQVKTEQPQAAVCHLVASAGYSVSGDLQLSQEGKKVTITGVVKGLTKGEHGFHLHQVGDTGNDCKAAGSHFNPDNSNHGDPKNRDGKKHAGDFGNILADENGVANFSTQTEQISLTKGDDKSALGRAFVVHAQPDDLGQGNTEESLKTGSAGARVACCVVNTV